MNKGTIVYLRWYDFQKQTEHICKGEVVDNELWAGTKQADMINVHFQAPGMAAPICHHFAADRLSMVDSDVPHDECYLVCGKKTRAYQHDATVKKKPQQASDAWQQVQQFKRDRWDYKRGHLDIDALDEFYQLWHDAIAAKLGYREYPFPPHPYVPMWTDWNNGLKPQPISPLIAEAINAAKRIVPDEKMEELKEKLKETFKEPTAKEKRSTGSITYKDSIQTSLFE